MKSPLSSITLTLALLSLLALGIVFYISKGGVPAAQAKTEANTCSLSKLAGSYGYIFNGFFSPSAGFNVPIGAVGMATIGEDGSITNIDTLVVNGQVTENRTYSGAITLNPDNPCMGTATYDNGLKDNFVVVNDGQEVQFIQIASPAPATSLQVVITGSAKKQ